MRETSSQQKRWKIRSYARPLFFGLVIGCITAFFISLKDSMLIETGLARFWTIEYEPVQAKVASLSQDAKFWALCGSLVENSDLPFRFALVNGFFALLLNQLTGKAAIYRDRILAYVFDGEPFTLIGLIFSRLVNRIFLGMLFVAFLPLVFFGIFITTLLSPFIFAGCLVSFLLKRWKQA